MPKTDTVTLPDNYYIDLNFKRNNRDKTVNSQGKLLLEMCIESRLRILNGRFLGDSVGNFTYFDALGGCSVVDYMIVSEDIIPCISYFNVMLPNEWSGHCIINSGIKIDIPQDRKEDYSQMDFWPGNFKWKDSNLQNYSDQLTSEETVSDLAMFLSEIDTCTDSQVDINHFTNQLSNILIKAASNSIKFKINHRQQKGRSKPKHRNKWFNNNCMLMRREIRRLGRKVQKEPYNNEVKTTFFKVRKNIKIC